VASRLECRPVNTVAAGPNVLVLAEVLGEDYRRLARPA
jgi:flavin reductase (DIM6/NTAB) family NADH-FMN oxidoreductase RutF